MQALSRFVLIALALVGLAATLVLLAPEPGDRRAVVRLENGESRLDGDTGPGEAATPRQPNAASRDVTPPSAAMPPAGEAPVAELPPRDVLSEAPRESEFVLLHQPVAIDTGSIGIGEGTVDLIGVDPVPLAQQCGSGAGTWPCGMSSRTALRSFLRARSIRCEAPEDFGTRQESVESTCELGGSDIGEWVVRNGWGTAAGERYAEAEAQARTEGRGIWRGE